MNVFPHIQLDRVSSTNEFAAFLVSKTNPEEGTVISSVDQHDGRGQVGRNWHASPGQNITMSVILYPKHIEVHHQFDLNKILSLGIVSALSHILPEEEFQIKWPNDIYIYHQKVAGLLVQISSMGHSIRHAIFGIGINVHEKAFPSSLPNPVSLCSFSENIPGLKEVIHLVCTHLMDYYQLYHNGNHKLLDRNYQELLYKYNQKSIFSVPGGENFAGTIIGVDEIGKLMVETSSGLRTFAMTEVKMEMDH
jgi:BirA family biotin operon repressor/biotin-[acetyl-CoA-carboxylase] ligase